MIEHVELKDNADIDIDITGIARVLYCFFKEHKSGLVYSYKTDLNLTEEDEVELEQYGLFKIGKQPLDYVQRKLLIVPKDLIEEGNNSSIVKFLEKNVQEINITHILFEYDMSNYPGVITLMEKIQGNLSECVSLNEKMNVLSVSSRERLMSVLHSNSLYVSKNLKKIIEKIDTSQDADIYIQAILKSLELLEKEHNPNNIYYYDSEEFSNAFEQVYLCIAAYLTVTKGYHFIISSSSQENYFSKIRDLHSRNYMYLADYLRFILNFPLCSVFLSRNTGGFYLQDTSKFKQKKCFIKGVTVEVEQNKIVSSSLKNYDEIDPFNVELLSPCQIFSFDKGNNLEQLDLYENIVAEYTLLLGQEGYLSIEKPILCNYNSLFYKKDDKLYLTYVTDLKYIMPMIVRPFNPQLSTYNTMADLEDLKNLMPVQVLFDYDKVLSKIIRNVDLDTVTQFCYPMHTIKGFFQKAKFKNTVNDSTTFVTKEGPLSISEVGLWDLVESDYRDIRLQSLNNVINVNELIKQKQVTVWGLYHPFRNNLNSVLSISLDNTVWR